MRTAGYLMSFLMGTLLVHAAAGQSTASYDEQMAGVLRSTSGQDRAVRLLELARSERQRGRSREAIELSIQAASEADKHGLDMELCQSLMELAMAHEQKGDLDQAIGAALRTTLVTGAHQSGMRTTALLYLAELYLKLGYAQKAQEHLSDAASTALPGKLDPARYLRAEARARILVLGPGASIGYLQEAAGKADQLGEPYTQLLVRSLLATALAKEGRNDEAYRTEEEVLDLAIRQNRALEATISANNLGELLQRMGRDAEANQVFAKGMIMAEDKPDLLLNICINAAHAQAKSGDHTAAQRLLDEAKELSRRQPSVLPRLLRTAAAVDLLRGELSNAQDLARASLKTAEDQGDLLEQAASHEMLAHIYDRRLLPQEARKQLSKARELGQLEHQRAARAKVEHEAHLLRLQRIEREQAELVNREQRKEFKLRQMALDAENREKQLVLLTYEKQLEASAHREASLAKDQAEKELQLAHAALEMERNERTIRDLDNDRMLQTLSMTKLELEQKEQLRVLEALEQRNEVMAAEGQLLEAERQRDQATQRLVALLAVLALGTAIWMARAWRITRRKKRAQWLQNQQFKAINQELNEKNQNIESSIRYARTIQSAILPTEPGLRALVPDSFLLYRPLDQVSGDLPFITRSGNILHVAAIDCTGHGVPAAMMTFIAYYGLNELIGKLPGASCGRLLDLLHEHVKSTMDSRGDSGLYNDGMDIGLCRIDLDTGQVNFAGAQLSMLRWSNGTAKRIKGDALPLGDAEFQRTKSYTDHQFQLAPNDGLFLFSDGLIHQFGGEDGLRKFSLRKLTATLEAHAHLELEQVKALTEQEFLQWKGDVPQTDDILMIGLRFAA